MKIDSRESLKVNEYIDLGSKPIDKIKKVSEDSDLGIKKKSPLILAIIFFAFFQNPTIQGIAVFLLNFTFTILSIKKLI